MVYGAPFDPNNYFSISVDSFDPDSQIYRTATPLGKCNKNGQYTFFGNRPVYNKPIQVSFSRLMKDDGSFRLNYTNLIQSGINGRIVP